MLLRGTACGSARDLSMSLGCSHFTALHPRSGYGLLKMSSLSAAEAQIHVQPSSSVAADSDQAAPGQLDMMYHQDGLAVE